MVLVLQTCKMQKFWDHRGFYSDFRREALQCEAVRVKPKVQWRPQEAGDTRNTECLAESVSSRSQWAKPPPKIRPVGCNHQGHRDGAIQAFRSLVKTTGFNVGCTKFWSCFCSILFCPSIFPFRMGMCHRVLEVFNFLIYFYRHTQLRVSLES